MVTYIIQAIGHMYSKMKREAFFAKPICLFTFGGYAFIKIPTYFDKNVPTTIADMLMMAVIILSVFINAYNLGSIIEGFIKWYQWGLDEEKKKNKQLV